MFLVGVLPCLFFWCIFVEAGREDFEVSETTSKEKNPENGWERKMILSLPFWLVWGPIFRGELAVSIREGRSIGLYIISIMYIYLSLCILCILAMYTYISIFTVIYTYMYVYYI